MLKALARLLSSVACRRIVDEPLAFLTYVSAILWLSRPLISGCRNELPRKSQKGPSRFAKTRVIINTQRRYSVRTRRSRPGRSPISLPFDDVPFSPRASSQASGRVERDEAMLLSSFGKSPRQSGNFDDATFVAAQPPSTTRIMSARDRIITVAARPGGSESKYDDLEACWPKASHHRAHHYP